MTDFSPADPAWEQRFRNLVAGEKTSGVEDYARILAAALNRPETDDSLIERLGRTVAETAGLRAAINALDRAMLLAGRRRLRIGIYDHTWSFIGGAQKYGATMAEALKTVGEVTLIGNRPFSMKHLAEWYRLDLDSCAMRIVPLPYYEKKGGDYIDPADISSRAVPNPFHAVARASLDYDVFVNNSMLEMVLPLSHRSVFVTHFPERRPRSYFYVDRYDRVVFNSRYTAEWIEKRWGIKPHVHIYPPVDMPGPRPENKERLILSAARFDPGGNKQQLEMIHAFRLFLRRYPRQSSGWRLILAGGSHGDNPYLDRIKNFLEAHPGLPVELRINIPADDLRDLYRRASLFWHFCGLGQSDPALVEHFGMTVAEAMQSGCVPLVFDGGGMREIVRSGETGYLFSSLNEAVGGTARLAGQDALRASLAEAAWKSGKTFAKDVFSERVRRLIGELLAPAPTAG